MPEKNNLRTVNRSFSWIFKKRNFSSEESKKFYNIKYIKTMKIMQKNLDKRNWSLKEHFKMRDKIRQTSWLGKFKNKIKISINFIKKSNNTANSTLKQMKALPKLKLNWWILRNNLKLKSTNYNRSIVIWKIYVHFVVKTKLETRAQKEIISLYSQKTQKSMMYPHT